MGTSVEETTRREKLTKLATNPFQQTKFFRDYTLSEVKNKWSNLSQAELKIENKEARVAEFRKTNFC